MHWASETDQPALQSGADPGIAVRGLFLLPLSSPPPLFHSPFFPFPIIEFTIIGAGTVWAVTHTDF